jgi:hypothetical protein
MKLMTKSKLLSLLTLVFAAGFALATLGSHGCTSNCAGNCPATTVLIGSNDDHELSGILTNLDVNGTACPARDSVVCIGDPGVTSCSSVSITAPQAGTCDVLFVFSDRPSEILRLQFGDTANANGSCCRGYPVLGPSVYTIPDKPTGPIYSGTTGTPTYDTDAVVVVTDAGADAADAANP